MPTPIIHLNRKYYINIGEKGTFYPGNNPIFNSTPKEIDDLFLHFLNNDITKLALYFHGGLVSAESGMETAQRVVKYITQDTDAHPICFIWETGLRRTIVQNLDTIGQSEFFKKLLIKILKVAGRHLNIEALDAIGTAKGMESMSEREIAAELKKDAPFENYQISVQAKSASVLDAKTLVDDVTIETRLRLQVEAELEEEIEDDVQLKSLAAQEKPEAERKLMNREYKDVTEEGDKGIISAVQLIAAAVKITLRVIKRHLQKQDHDFYPTVIEEILREIYVADLGNWLWGNMKQKASDMWKSNNFQDNYQDWPAGSYFIKKLEEHQQHIGTKLTVDLIGHSAGSIVICELIRKLSQGGDNIQFRHIIFMAPACRCDLFDSTILALPASFTSFRCFTMKDEMEKKDHLVKFIYPRSLLYLISGILEKESDACLLGLQRHITGNEPYTGDMFSRIANFLKTEGNIVYAITDAEAADGLRSGAITHGGFDDEKEITLESIMHLINQ
jgi:hypothetical protein